MNDPPKDETKNKWNREIKQIQRICKVGIRSLLKKKNLKENSTINYIQV